MSFSYISKKKYEVKACRRHRKILIPDRAILKVCFSDACLIKLNKVKIKEEKQYGKHSEILNNWVNCE